MASGVPRHCSQPVKPTSPNCAVGSPRPEASVPRTGPQYRLSAPASVPTANIRPAARCGYRSMASTARRIRILPMTQSAPFLWPRPSSFSCPTRTSTPRRLHGIPGGATAKGCRASRWSFCTLRPPTSSSGLRMSTPGCNRPNALTSSARTKPPTRMSPATAARCCLSITCIRSSASACRRSSTKREGRWKRPTMRSPARKPATRRSPSCWQSFSRSAIHRFCHLTIRFLCSTARHAMCT